MKRRTLLNSSLALAPACTVAATARAGLAQPADPPRFPFSSGRGRRPYDCKALVRDFILSTPEESLPSCSLTGRVGPG